MSGNIQPASIFSVLETCNGALMESDCLGNDVAKSAQDSLKMMDPLYKDMDAQAQTLGTMEKYMFWVQVGMVCSCGTGVLAGALAGGMTAATEAASAAMSAVSNVAQAAASTMSGTIQIRSALSQAELTLDQAKTSIVTNENQTLTNLLKRCSSEGVTIGQDINSLIRSEAQAFNNKVKQQPNN